MLTLPVDWEHRWYWLRVLVSVILAVDSLALWHNWGWNFGPGAVVPLTLALPRWVFLLPALFYLLPLAIPHSKAASVLAWAALVIVLTHLSAVSYGLHTVGLCFLFCTMLATFTGPTALIWHGSHALLSLVYLNAAYAKLWTPEWHSGEVVGGILQHLAISLPVVAMIGLGYVAILLQLLHLHTLFTRRGRSVYLLFVIGMHSFAALALGHYLISLLMVGLNVVFLWPSKDALPVGE